MTVYSPSVRRHAPQSRLVMCSLAPRRLLVLRIYQTSVAIGCVTDGIGR